MIAFDVYRPHPTIPKRWVHHDTIFYSDTATETATEVKRSLIDHDGYPGDIAVAKRYGVTQPKRVPVRVREGRS